jgi:hypothetical protein
MRGSGTAWRTSTRRRARRLSAQGLGALVALLVALPATASAAGITFSAPSGAHTYPDQSEGPAGYTEALAFRTTDTRPVIAIAADGGTQLQCHFDDVFVTQTCGGPAPGCAAICGSFQPPAPLGPDSDEFSRAHFLAVDLVDADGNTLASEWVNIDVDTTPPVIKLASTGGLLINGTAGGNTTEPLRPNFDFDVTDSNSVGTDVDTVACAWGPATSSSPFGPCGGKTGSGSFDPRVPARHRLYRLQVRATDDFGRSTTASGVYDPIPCTLSIKRPGRIASLLSSGIPTHLNCETTRHVAVAIYAFMVDGDKSATPRGAVSDNPILGEYRLSSKTSTFKASRRLRLSRAARTALRQARSIGLVVAAGDPDKIESGFADDSLSYQAFTLHR